MLEHYRSSDIFVLPCRIAPDGDRDGLPNVIVEAQSQAVCCVSTDVSGVPELIENDETGLLVASEDAQALADALQASIADPALRARLGSAGRDKVRAQFDMRSSIDALRGLFDKVLPAGTRRNRASATQ